MENRKLEKDKGIFYYGLFLDYEEENALTDYLEERDIEIENLCLSDLHVTLASVSNDEAMDYFDKMIEDNKLILGENVKIHVDAYGECRDENGELLNQVLKVSLGNPELEKFCDCGIAYITLSSNSEDQDEVHLSENIDIDKCNFTKELDFNIDGRFGALNERKRVSYERLPKMYKLGNFKGHNIFIRPDTIDNPENSYFGSYLSENPKILELVQTLFEESNRNQFMEYDGDYFKDYFVFPDKIGVGKLTEANEEDIVRVVLPDKNNIYCYTLKEAEETNTLTIEIKIDQKDPLARLVLVDAFPGRFNEKENSYRTIDATEGNLLPNIEVDSTIKTLNYLKNRGGITKAEEKFLGDYEKINNVMEKAEKDYEDFYKENKDCSCEDLKKYLFYCLVKEPDKFEQIIEEVKESDFPFKTLENRYLDFKDPQEEEKNRENR